MYTYKFSTFAMAANALKIARRIYPTSYFYISNELGNWHIHLGYEYEEQKTIQRKS